LLVEKRKREGKEKEKKWFLYQSLNDIKHLFLRKRWGKDKEEKM